MKLDQYTLQCQECYCEFNPDEDDEEPECPRCGSSDIEPAYEDAPSDDGISDADPGL